ncbi:MAG: transport system ATP-binding/permease protein [Pseudonocardiales bacterium]|nr:transport system ATP-binding/permease protein [Pseudonocardiales bacterium]
MSAPLLVVDHGAHRVTVPATSAVTVGRNAECGLNIEEPRVSRNHATVWFESAAWRLRNVGQHGTWVDGRRIDDLTITGPCAVRLGAPDGPELRFTPLPVTVAVPAMPVAPAVPADWAVPGPPVDRPDRPAPSAWTAERLEQSYSVALAGVHQLTTAVITVGRAAENTVVLQDLSASRQHAVFRLTGAGVWTVEDLGSTAGTFVDGRRITAAVRVDERSLIGIGRQLFRFRAGTLEEYQDTGAVTFGARGLVVDVPGKRLLAGVDFSLQPNSMMVIIGPSGSGKTTLLRALTGARPADGGQVLYGGRDFYQHYDELRDRIGFVPQDDILHPQLRVRDALDYAARLRFPADVDAQTRRARVDAVIAELGLHAQAGQRIATLSGGQRKRSSTAMELLTRPSLLFLDEPTSGLDINRDREVMRMLRELADAGRTVIVVSHNVGYIDLADRVLVLANGGHLAFYGPPAETLAFFKQDDWADMYAALERDDLPWRAQFDQSSRASLDALPAAPGAALPRTDATAQRSRALDHLRTLCRRYTAVLAADRQFVALMIAMPALLALFAHAVPGGAGLSTRQAIQDQTRGPLQLMLVMVVGCCMMGTATALREIVKERAILLRERAVGLSWQAYLASKAVVLGFVVTVQSILLTLLSTLGQPGADEAVLGGSAMVDLLLAFVPITLASMAIGLSVSSIVKNSDRALPVLVVVIMAQLLLSGGLFPLHGRAGLEQLAWLSPARWGFAAGASLTGFSRMPGWHGDPLWDHSTGTFVFDVAMLLVITALYIAGAALLVRRIGRPPRVARR